MLAKEMPKLWDRINQGIESFLERRISLCQEEMERDLWEWVL